MFIIIQVTCFWNEKEVCVSFLPTDQDLARKLFFPFPQINPFLKCLTDFQCCRSIFQTIAALRAPQSHAGKPGVTVEDSRDHTVQVALGATPDLSVKRPCRWEAQGATDPSAIPFTKTQLAQPRCPGVTRRRLPARCLPPSSLVAVCLPWAWVSSVLP